MRQGDRVIGVYEHCDEERDRQWEVRWIESGKPRSKYYRTEINAQDFAGRTQLRLQGPAPLPGAVRVDTQAEDARGDWTGALERVRDLVLQNPGDERYEDMLRALSAGANAAAKLIDAEGRRRRLERLERLAESERKERAAAGAAGATDAKRSKRGDAPSKA